MNESNQPPTSKSSRTDGNQGFRPFIKPLQTQNISAQQSTLERSNETSFDKMDNYNAQLLRGTASQHHLDDNILTRSYSVPYISRDEFQQRNYHKVSSQV